MTVLEAIQRSTEFLARKGVESARLHTELLLAHLLKLPRMQLYLNFERALSQTEVDGLRELVRRRGQREPLQQIVGSTSFCGFEIVLNREVLVPRPETEILAEQGWVFLNEVRARIATASSSDGTSKSDCTPSAGLPSPPLEERARERRPLASEFSSASPGPLALDFGTGSGCLAVALAGKCPEAEVYAIDSSTAALEIARQNAARHNLTGRIRLFQGDGLQALPLDLKFDLIVSNPPYIPADEIASLEPEVRDYEPRQALDGGADGLDYYRKLAVEVPPFLKPEGRLMVEFGDGQAERIREILAGQKWVVGSVIEDYTQRPRVLIAWKAY
jgi:release factor glutamine methyltransferase